MEKTVVELFAGVGGFRVGLNNIEGFDENGRLLKIEIGNLFGLINGSQVLKYNRLMSVTKVDLEMSV